MVRIGVLGVRELRVRVRKLRVKGDGTCVQLKIRGKELRVSVRVQPGSRVRVGGRVRELSVRVCIRASLWHAHRHQCVESLSTSRSNYASCM